LNSMSIPNKPLYPFVAARADTGIWRNKDVGLYGIRN
jgi:hypothetical protein